MTPLASKAVPAGFTLVELLVAMTLLGFLTVLLFGGLQFGTRAWERSRELTVDDNAIRAVQTRLMNELANAFAARADCGNGCRAAAFEGEARSVTLLSTAYAVEGDRRNVHIATAVSGDGLGLRIESRGELAVAGQIQSQTVLDRLESLDFSYYGRAIGGRVPAWHDTWHQQRRLPDLIRVRARMADHRLTWPDLVIAPRMTALAGCAIDLLTHDCQE